MPSTCAAGSMPRKFSSKYVQTTLPPRFVKPASWSCSRNGAKPGGTVVLNTTWVPLAMIFSIVSR